MMMAKHKILNGKGYDLSELIEVVGTKTKSLLFCRANGRFLLREGETIRLLTKEQAADFMEIYRDKITKERFEYVARIFFSDGLLKNPTLLPQASAKIATAAGECLSIFFKSGQLYLSADGGNNAVCVSRKNAFAWIERHQDEIADLDNLLSYFPEMIL